MAEAVVELMRALNGTRRAYNRAANAITPEQENRELRVLGGNLMVVGVFNTAISYHAFTNPRAIPNYMPEVIPLVVQGSTLVAGVIMMATGCLLLVGDNPRQHGYLTKIILLLGFIATGFTIGSSSSG